MRKLWSHIACMLAVALVFVGTASAQKKYTRLDYERSTGAESCASKTDLKVNIGAVLGYNPFRTNASLRFRIRVSPRPAGVGYRARISIDKPGQEGRKIQKLESGQSNCQPLVESVVLAVSVAIDPSVGLSRRALSGARGGSTPTAMQLGQFRISLASAAARSRAYRQLFSALEERDEGEKVSSNAESPVNDSGSLIGGLGMAGGTTPGATFSPLVGGEARFGHFSVRLEGRIDIPKEASTERGTFESSALLGELAGCNAINQWFGCAVFAGGVIRQRGVALQTNRDTVTPYLAVGGRLGRDAFITESLGIRLRGELLASLVEVKTTVNDREVWQTPVVSGHLGAFLFVRFE